MLKVLIIEDESTARDDLRSKLAEHPAVAVVGEAATVGTGRKLLESAEYDLVFLDIHLIGGEGFALVPAVKPSARIVFATAFDRYALRAIEVNALDYLLKPVVPARLAEALRRAGASPPTEEDSATDFPASLQVSDRVYLRSSGRGRFAAVDEICQISSDDNYSAATLASGETMLLRKSLAAWEAVLPPSHFFRVHRTVIVNLARVLRYERSRDERTLLFVEGVPEPIAASRRSWPELRARLAELRPEL